jgi:hypothetical protein
MKKTLISGLSSLLIPIGAYGAAIGGGYSYTSRAKPATASSEWMTQYRAEPPAAPALAQVENIEPQLRQGQLVRELVIIDEAVADKDLIYKQLTPGSEAILIRSDENGLSQLETILARYSNLQALHIFSHAKDGELLLGNSRITEHALHQSTNTLATLDGALLDGADVLFYGCELAASGRGESLLALISGTANVDVAASSDLTGSSERGGDWELELKTGDINAELSFDSAAMKDFSSVLQFSGTLNLDNVPTGYASTKSYTILTTAYTISFESQAGNSNDLYNFSGGYVYVGTFSSTQSSSTMSFTAGETFDLTSINVRNGDTSSRTIRVTSDLGGSEDATLGAFASTTMNFSGPSWTNIGTVTFQYDDGATLDWIRLDDIALSNLSPAPDNDGDLTASTTVSEPVAIDTTIDTVGEAIDVFDFTLSDGGGGDGQPMTVSQISVNVSGTSNDTVRDQVTWRLNGNDASNVVGTYSAGADTITFAGLSISIADAGSETYTINAYYNASTGLTEDNTFILSVDGDTDVTVGASGTQMGATTAVSNGSGSTVDVIATQLAFTTQPATSISGSALGTQPVVTAQDAFGNTDLDFTETITLTEASAGALSNGSVAASSGVATFSNVTYTASADQQSFTLTANDQDGVATNLSTVDANAVTSDVVATQLAFNLQPDPLAVDSGVATNFTTVPVVSARDGDGVTDTGYSTAITLAEVNGAGSATMTATGDTDGNGATVSITPSSGVSTFTSMQITYTASGGSSETFNLQASSGGLSPATSSQLTGVVDSTPPTITDGNISISGASGTAGAFIVGDTVTATWNNTASGDNNNDVASVTVDFSQFGGGAAVAASNSSDTWTATYLITEDGGGSIDATNRNVSVTATDNNSNADTVADSSNAMVDNDSPAVTDANVSISGASGLGGAFIVGDTVTASWDNTIGGDNNSDTISSVTVDFSQFGGGAAVVANNSIGTWTATFTITESGGGAIDATNRNVSLTATDNAGNSTTTADSSNATIDNVSPSLSEITAVTTPTNDTTPDVTINTDQAGTLSIGGSCGSGDEGAIAAGGNTITLTQADNSTPLADATYSDCTATVVDDAGNASNVLGLTAFTVDTTAPAAPSTPDMDAGADTGSSNTDDITNNTTPTFTGTAEANSTIELSSSVDGAVGSTTADGAGNWSITASILSTGAHNITATATDGVGNTSGASAALAITIDTTPPAAPGALDLNAASDSGTSDSDDLTNVITPLITGTAEANIEVELSSDQDGVLGTLTSDGSGIWSATPTLSENVHQLTTTATDAAGNTSAASTALALTVDTTPPAAPSIPDLDAASDTGSSDTDNITSDTTPSFSGTAENDASIELFSDQDGSIGSATADGAGNWQITANALSLATHAITAQATDAAGNQGTASASLSVEVDTDAPTLSIAAPAPTASNSGPISFTLNYANVDSVDLQAGDITPIFTGDAAGTVNIVDGTSMTPQVQLTGLTGDGTVTITVAADTGEDSAGNTTPETGPSTAATIDNTAPSVSFGTPSPSSTGVGPITFPLNITGADTIALTVADVSIVSADGVTGDIAVNAGTTANPEVAISNLSGFGQIAIQLAADVASDEAGNNSAASATSPAVTLVDEAPVFTASGPFSVIETAANGTVVGDIDANDGNGGAADEGISYSITAGNTAGGFAIDAASGEITVADNTALNFSTDPAPVLTVRADDSALTSDTSVTINLTQDTDSDSDGIPNDVEDNGPNNGDGNNDGTPDSQQDNVASFVAANGNTYITVEALDCSTVDILGTGNPSDDTGSVYPFGTVRFSVPCNSAEVAITVADVGNANLPASVIRARIATGPTKAASDYVTLSDALRSNNLWLLSLSDAEAYDLNTTNPGVVFSGGPAVPANSTVVAIPTLDWLGRLALAMLLGLAGLGLIARRR